MTDKHNKITEKNNKFSLKSITFAEDATDDLSLIKELYVHMIIHAIKQEMRLEAINKEDSEK